MIAPFARSIPETRMTRVCPSASVPITTDCCAISDMLPGFMKVEVVAEKTATMTIKARSGPVSG